MSWDWQLVVASVCVAAAIFVLGRRAMQFWNGAPERGCGSGCSSCSESPASNGATIKPLVSLELSDRELPTRLQLESPATERSVAETTGRDRAN